MMVSGKGEKIRYYKAYAVSAMLTVSLLMTMGLLYFSISRAPRSAHLAEWQSWVALGVFLLLCSGALTLAARIILGIPACMEPKRIITFLLVCSFWYVPFLAMRIIAGEFINPLAVVLPSVLMLPVPLTFLFILHRSFLKEEKSESDAEDDELSGKA